LRHGSLTDPRDYVVTERLARACLDELDATLPAANILVVGTHAPTLVVSGRHGTLLRSAVAGSTCRQMSRYS
jgi:hypothetical protein